MSDNFLDDDFVVPEYQFPRTSAAELRDRQERAEMINQEEADNYFSGNAAKISPDKLDRMVEYEEKAIEALLAEGKVGQILNEENGQVRRAGFVRTWKEIRKIVTLRENPAAGG